MPMLALAYSQDPEAAGLLLHKCFHVCLVLSAAMVRPGAALSVTFGSNPATIRVLLFRHGPFGKKRNSAI